MNEVHVSKISVSLLLLAALAVALYVYFTPENGSFFTQKASLGLSRTEYKHRNKRAIVKSKSNNILAGKKQTIKSPVNSKRPRGASGIEYDIDDPYDDVMHDVKELLGARRPCSKSETCRKKRHAIKLMAKSLKISDDDNKRKKRASEKDIRDTGILTNVKENAYILFPREKTSVGRQFVTGNSQVRNRLFHTATSVRGNVNDVSSTKLENPTGDKRFPRGIVEEEDDGDGNELLDELARYKRNNKGNVDTDRVGNEISKSISYETDDAEHDDDRTLPERIVKGKKNDEDKRGRSINDNYNNVIGRLKREINDVAYEEYIDDPNSGYGPWESWSQCSVTCGLGRSDRKRICHNTDRCLSGDVEIRMCLPQDCR